MRKHLVPKLASCMMDVSLYIVFVGLLICRAGVADEQHCSKYHYEAQTLERIIMAEFSIGDVKKEVKVIKNEIESEKASNNDEIAKLEKKLLQLQEGFENFKENVSILFLIIIYRLSLIYYRNYCLK